MDTGLSLPTFQGFLEPLPKSSPSAWSLCGEVCKKGAPYLEVTILRIKAIGPVEAIAEVGAWMTEKDARLCEGIGNN